MAFPEGKFFQNGVDLVNLCESDYCNNLISATNYFFNNDVFAVPQITGDDDLDFKTDFYAEGEAIIFPRIGCCPIPRSDNMIAFPDLRVSVYDKPLVTIKKESGQIVIDYESSDGYYTNYYKKDIFYRGTLPEVICIALQGAGGGGAGSLGETAGPGAAGGAGGFAIVLLKLKTGDSLKIKLGNSGYRGDHGDGGDGGDSTISINEDTIVTIYGGKGGRGIHGGAGGEVSPSVIVPNDKNEYLVQVISCTGGAGGGIKEGVASSGTASDFDSQSREILRRTQSVYDSSKVHPGEGGYGGGGGSSVFADGGDGAGYNYTRGQDGGIGAGGGGGNYTEESRGGDGGGSVVRIYLGYPAEV